MYKFLSFIVIFSLVSIMIYFHNQSGHFGASSHAEIHNHKQIVIPPSNLAPSITGSIKQDSSGTWLLEVQTNHFRLTPKKVGTGDIRFGEGHAHLYINGEKINRLYSHYYDLGYFRPGTYHIKVTLNENNHGVFTHNGEEISFNQTINIPKVN